MTLNQIVYEVAGRMNQPLNDLLAAEIAFAVQYWGAFLIRQDVERNGNDPQYVQSVIKTLEKVDKADSCVVDLGCSVLRTVNTLPYPVSTKIRAPFVSVQLADLKSPIGYVPYEHLFAAGKGRNIAGRIFYTWKNRRLYIYNNNKLGYVTISMIPVNPLDLVEDCIAETSCVGPDDQYPLPGHIVRIAIDGMVKGEFSLRPVNNHEVEIEHEQEQKFQTT